MMRMTILLAALAGCLDPGKARCMLPDPPPGACDPNASENQPGGHCSTEDPECVSGYSCYNNTCYPCGPLGDLACGTQMSVGTSTCDPGNGTPVQDPNHDNQILCEDVAGNSPSGMCEPGEPPTWFLWVQVPTCVSAPVGLCGTQEQAQAYVDQNFANTPHTDLATTPLENQPPDKYYCGEGSGCILGSEGNPLKLPYFSDPQVGVCEGQLDPNCTDWHECD